MMGAKIEKHERISCREESFPVSQPEPAARIRLV